MKIWGYWTTLGWSIVAFLLGQFVGFGVLLWLRGGDWDSILQTPFDGVLVTIFVALSNPAMIAVLAIAGSLAAKKRVPVTVGTMPTHGPTFVVLLIGTVLLVGALTFVPALALGPLSVRPDSQRRGVGSALVHAVLGAADALDEPQPTEAPWPVLHKPFSGEELERAIAAAAAPP